MRSNHRFGCNAFEAKRPISRPMSFWRSEDVWKYIQENSLPISSIYSLGYERTGCMFCLYGHHFSGYDRIELIKKTHPKIYEYMMKKLGLDVVLQWYPKKVV